MVFLPILVLFIVLAFSLEKNTIGEANTFDRNQQLAMRGLFACYIIFSHMYRNSDVFDNSLASNFILMICPSLLCVFFFYSGYGAMYKYIEKGVVPFRKCLLTWISKLIAPAAIAFVFAIAFNYIITGSYDQMSPLAVFNEFGGWFLKTLIVLQLIFWISSRMTRTKGKEYFIVTLFGATVIAVAAMRLMGLQSYYYIDCFAFVFGAASCLYPKWWFKLISNRAIVALSGVFTIFAGGGIPILLQSGILPSRMGIGLIVGFINSLVQVVWYQSLLIKFRYKKGNLLECVGKCSYEIYLAGSCAFVIALRLAQGNMSYYVVYTIGCICMGVAIKKVSSFLL